MSNTWRWGHCLSCNNYANIVVATGMCGPCTTGEADCDGPEITPSPARSTACPHCSRKFIGAEGLRQHIKHKHGGSNTPAPATDPAQQPR
jgi:hypothetical protein